MIDLRSDEVLEGKDSFLVWQMMGMKQDSRVLRVG